MVDITVITMPGISAADEEDSAFVLAVDVFVFTSVVAVFTSAISTFPTGFGPPGF